MNLLFIGVLLFLLLSALDGHRKGFIRKAVGIVSLILTLAIVSVAEPAVSRLLQEKTSLYDTLQKAILNSNTDIFQALEIIGIDESMSAYLANMILGLISFLITFIFVCILIQGITYALDLAAKLPVLNGLNKLAGFILGLAEGVLFIWIFFFLVTVLATTEPGGRLLELISENSFLAWMYRENMLFRFLHL